MPQQAHGPSPGSLAMKSGRRWGSIIRATRSCSDSLSRRKTRSSNAGMLRGFSMNASTPAIRARSDCPGCAVMTTNGVKGREVPMVSNTCHPLLSGRPRSRITRSGCHARKKATASRAPPTLRTSSCRPDPNSRASAREARTEASSSTSRTRCRRRLADAERGDVDDKGTWPEGNDTKDCGGAPLKGGAGNRPRQTPGADRVNRRPAAGANEKEPERGFWHG